LFIRFLTHHLNTTKLYRAELLIVAIILIAVGLVAMNWPLPAGVNGVEVIYWLGVVLVIVGVCLFIYWLVKFAQGKAA
jgi:uncharacterized membrane protein HdeD (DUF308 family)